MKMSTVHVLFGAILSAAIVSATEYVVNNAVPYIDLNVASNYVGGVTPANFATRAGYDDTITAVSSPDFVQALALSANPSYVGNISADDTHNLYYSAKGGGAWSASAYFRTLAGFSGQFINANPRNFILFDSEAETAGLPQADMSMGLQLSVLGAGKTLEVGKAAAIGRIELNIRDVTADTAADIEISDPLFGARTDLRHGYGRLTLNVGDHSAELVGDPYLHFDATDTASMTTVETDGKTYVTRLNDVRGEGHPYAVKNEDKFRPWLATDATTGKQVLDFGGSYCDYGWPVDHCKNGRRTGEWSTGIPVASSGETAWLKLNEKCSTIREVFVVFREAHIFNCQAYFLGNDNLKTNYFRRGFFNEADNGSKYEGAFHHAGRLFRRRGNGIYYTDTSLVQCGDVRLDGQRVQADMVVSLADKLHVLSAGLPGDAAADRIGDNGFGTCVNTGGDNRNWAVGGFTLGEMLIYTNNLTSAERRRINNYLKTKWGAGEDKTDVNFGHAQISANGTLDVPEGREVRVKKSQIPEKIVKDGTGRLDLGVPESSGFAVEVKAGELAFSKTFEPTTTVPTAPAPNSDVWVDADNVASLVLSNAAENVYVIRANHCENGGTNSASNIAWAERFNPARYYPTLVTDANAQGRKVFDCGPYNWDYTIKDTSTSMIINKTVTTDGKNDTPTTLNNNMLSRGGFIVFRTSTKPDVILGGRNRDYKRDTAQSGALLTPAVDVSGELAYEYFSLDGKKIDPLSTPISEGEYHVLGYRLSTPRGLNETAGRGTMQTGGTRIGEWISYDRELTDQEFRDTEAYLMNKWLGKPHPDVAMVKGEKTVTVNSLKLGTGAKFSTDFPMVIDSLASESGDFTKGGSGAVSVSGSGVDLNITNITVTAGSLDFDASVEGLMAGAYFRFDASDASTITTNAQGEVTEWRDKNGNGFKAIPLTNATFVVDHSPRLITETINGHDKPAMDLGDICYPKKASNQFTTTNNACAFELVKPDGTTGPSDYLREYFVVYKDKITTRASESIFSTHSPAFGGYDNTTCSLNDELGNYLYHPCYNKNDEGRGINNGRYQQLLDCEAINYNYRMGEKKKSGAYHVLSYSVFTNSTDWLFRIRNIGGDVWPGNSDYAILGGQNVCEIMCFKEPMSYESRTNVTHYLMKKWLSSEGCDAPARPVAKVNVATGASFTGDFSGWSETSVAALGGGGSITMGNMTGVKEVTAAADAEGAVTCTTVNGTVTFADTVTVRLTVADDKKLAVGAYPILSAGTLLNFDLSNFTVDAPVSQRKCYWLSADGNILKLQVGTPGTLMSVR